MTKVINIQETSSMHLNKIMKRKKENDWKIITELETLDFPPLDGVLMSRLDIDLRNYTHTLKVKLQCTYV